MYISIQFHIPAPSQVKNKNNGKFILKTQAGKLISCLIAGINLAKKIVIIPCFLK